MSIYLDYAATTPVEPAVIDYMTEIMVSHAGNASSGHRPGRRAADVVTQATEELATMISAPADDIVWTSGATESINLALKGVVEFHGGGGHIISVVTEHHATLDTLTWLQKRGTRVSLLSVDANGRIDLDELRGAIAGDTRCVSVMYVNNETGVIQDIAAIGALCAENGVALHVDAAQALGKLAIDVDAMQIALLSMSAHKMGGPAGAGALYVRGKPRTGLAAQIHGGGQQRNRRSGTLPVHQIAGFGRACQLAYGQRRQMQHDRAALNRRLWSRLAGIGGIVCNSVADGAPHILNVSVPGVHGAALLTGLTEGEPALAVSSGSACSAARAESSYVLRAMGRSPVLAAAAVRFSLGCNTTSADVDRAAARMASEVCRLRAMAPRQAQLTAA